MPATHGFAPTAVPAGLKLRKNVVRNTKTKKPQSFSGEVLLATNAWATAFSLDAVRLGVVEVLV